MEFYVDFQPVGRKIQVLSGTSILEAAQAAGVGLSAVCGGQRTCGSCLVRLPLNSQISSPTAIEIEKIGEDELKDGYRLACQTKLQGATRIEIPVESLTSLQRTQVEGEERQVDLEPLVSIYDLNLEKPDKTNLQADWERLCQELVREGAPQPKRCQINIIKQLPGILRKNNWKVRVGLRHDYPVFVSAPQTPVLGLAIDIGTTKIAGYLLDLENGKTLALQGMMNPQIAYGEDVMARIAYTINYEDGLDTLQQAVVNVLNELALQLCDQADKKNELATNKTTYHPSQIVEAVIVGNTAMHHIFLGLPVRQLGLAPYTAAITSSIDVKAGEIGLAFASGSVIHMLPNIAGFVGADHVSMLLATGITTHKKRIISLDIGTNTEITLATDNRMIACSTASGPAFEGAHIKDGMRAAEGAIEKIRVIDNRLEFQTIGNKKPVGICGSGILDAISQLRQAEAINQRGAMIKDHPMVRKGDNGLEVVIVRAEDTEHGHDIIINRKDVSEIQMAKGAIRAGIELLLKTAGENSNNIEEFIIAGAFGSFIDLKSAINIGMFPELPKNRFRQVGNAAGMGAKLSLLSKNCRNEAEAIAAKMEYLELSNHPDFTHEFAKAMGL